GLPEIEQHLKLDPPLAQRVAMRYRLEPFTEASTEAYVKHRLRLAGAPRMPFTPEAAAAIHHHSGGTPRVINTLCDNALYEAFLAGEDTIDADRIDRIAGNLGRQMGVQKEGAPTVTARPPSRPGTPPRTAGGRIDLHEIDRYLEGLGK